MYRMYPGSHKFRNATFGFKSIYWQRRVSIINGTCPGWIGDKDQRKLRFKKWVKRPDSAIRLYHRVREKYHF